MGAELVFSGGVEPRVARAVSGGPVVPALGISSQDDTLLLADAGVGELSLPDPADDAAGAATVDATAVLSSGNPLGISLPNRDGILIYRVLRGDTLSRIANRFGITVDTIAWANPGVHGGYLSAGEELTILPVTGVVHEVATDETLDTIAGLYGVAPEQITRANPKLSGQEPAPGDPLIIPGGKPRRTSAGQELPNLVGYFALPTTGLNWKVLHPVNAVDIANACGTPVYASQEGLVAEIGSPLSWNNGYGGYVKIEHPNGTATRYAHLSSVLVTEGDYVAQRDKIGEIGNTGNTHGPTGCHLHFEVAGAQNPFAK